MKVNGTDYKSCFGQVSLLSQALAAQQSVTKFISLTFVGHDKDKRSFIINLQHLKTVIV
jgi:hypothetical protein